MSRVLMTKAERFTFDRNDALRAIGRLLSDYRGALIDANHTPLAPCEPAEQRERLRLTLANKITAIENAERIIFNLTR